MAADQNITNALNEYFQPLKPAERKSKELFDFSYKSDFPGKNSQSR